MKPAVLHPALPARRSFYIAWVVLVIGLLITAAVTLYLKSDVDRIAEQEFIAECSDIQDKIAARLDDHARILRSGAALFKVSDTVTREKWRTFIERQQVQKELPGIQGIGFSLLIPRAELARHTQGIRKEGFPAYKVRPAGDRELYSSIIYLEPFTDRNLRAFGYDMFSEPVRRAAMEQARDMDSVTLSAKVILVQETGKDVQAGVLMYVPVYRKGMPTETVEQRRAAIYGWVYSPYRMNDLLRGILGSRIQEKEKRFHFEVFDGAHPSPENLLYQSHPAEEYKFGGEISNLSPERFTRQIPIDFNGQRWTLHFRQGSGGLFSAAYTGIGSTLGGGILITLLLVALLRSLLNTRAEAQRIANDITAELSANRVMLKQILDTVPQAIFWKDKAGVYLGCNLGFPATAGLADTEQIIGKTDFDMPWPRAEAEVYRADDAQVIESGMPKRNIVEPLQQADGARRWISTTKLPLLDARGDIHGVLGVFEDITERKQAEEALRESEELNRMILQTAKDGFWLANAQGRLLNVNEAYCRISGYGEQELLGMRIPDLEAHDSQSDTASHMEKISATGEDFFETRHRRKNGDIIDVEVSVQYRPTGDGLFVGFIRDVTGRRQAEEALDTARNDLEQRVLERTQELENVNKTLMVEIQARTQSETALHESELRYRTLFTQASIGIFILSKDGKVVDLNESFARMHGYSMPEMLRMNLKDLDTPETFKQVPERIRRIFAGELLTFEVEHYHKDGHIFPLEVSANMIAVGGESFMQCLHRDITDRKQAEQDRIGREAAEAATRAKSIFVANMSHEIRTPMNAILGFAQVLERDPSLMPHQVKNVRTITRSGEYLLRLINDILDISKIEAGRTTLNDAAFCLHDLLDDLSMMFRPRINARGLQFLMERDSSVPPYVIADEGKLRQVLVNLIGNAEKFTEAGGVAVRVRAKAVEGISGQDKETLRLWVEVEDTGRGIPDEDMGRIFGLFQQVGTRVKSGGAGLGLPISRKFAEMMGGEITATSEADKGSCFQFTALLKPAAAVAGRRKPTSRRIVGLEPGTGPYRILVVDDVPANRALLCMLLRPIAGFEIAEAANGAEALEIFARWSPRAVLMDMRMPVMDGYEATQRIKSTEAGRSTPVIAVTASAFDDSRKQVMAAGADAYLRKPFNITELFEILGKFLGLRYVFAEETESLPKGPETASLISSADPIALPQELVQAMRQAVEECDIARLTEQIVQAEKFDSDATRELQALADRYDFAKLGQWLEQRGIDND